MSNAGQARGKRRGKQAANGAQRVEDRQTLRQTAGLAAAGFLVGDDEPLDDEPMFPPDIDTELGGPNTRVWSFSPTKP